MHGGTMVTEDTGRVPRSAAPSSGTTQGEARRATVLGPGEGTPVWFLGNLMVVKATAQSTNGAYGLLESLVPAGSSPPMHVHHREDEAFWILEGAITVRCGDETLRAGPGSYVFLPRGVPHTYRVDGDTPLRMLTLLTPGGGEGFFVDGGRPAERLTMAPPGRPDLALLERVAHEYGAEFIGPPLAPAAARTPAAG
ncbi:MAG TPA: quercetin 2,3-dioxygenase [Gemmatimonadaceae bacterium]|nr:quercetin 2,3-dioxygenase [Gemmatimonadaceae bacterium]